MKQKWLEFSLGQKILFCLQIFLIVLFIILYSTVGRQQVLRYQDTSLRCMEMDSTIVYSGKVAGVPTSFRVDGNQVEYRWGDKTVHYSVREDAAAIPARETMKQMGSMHDALIGVEVHKNNSLLFRGAYLSFGDHILLFEESGEAEASWIVSASSDPSVYTILNILYTPNMTLRANFPSLLGGIFLCALCMISLLYADALFRWNLAFRIRNAEDAEPSDWELFSRWVGWLVFTGLALFVFILGLTGM